MRRLAVVSILIAATLFAACGSDDLEPLFREDGAAGAADYSYTIPAGSGEAIDRGEPLDILPQSLEVRRA